MGDLSAEPSMEEILSSIKRIIAEEGDGTAPRARRGRAAPSPVPPAADEDESDEGEILELSDPMPGPVATGRPAAPIHAAPIHAAPIHAALPSTPEPVAPAPEPAAAIPPVPAADPILSAATAAASRDALGALSRVMVKPEPAGDGTLEGLVREMLRPMLREWLDANLPELVETMVAREIAKLSGPTA